MDEPCCALDPIATARIEELMRELKSRFTIVIVTHNMQQAARVERPHRLLHDRAGQREGPAHRHASSSTTRRPSLFSNPRDERTENYITGRFG